MKHWQHVCILSRAASSRHDGRRRWDSASCTGGVQRRSGGHRRSSRRTDGEAGQSVERLETSGHSGRRVQTAREQGQRLGGDQCRRKQVVQRRGNIRQNVRLGTRRHLVHEMQAEDRQVSHGTFDSTTIYETTFHLCSPTENVHF